MSTLIQPESYYCVRKKKSVPNPNHGSKRDAIFRIRAICFGLHCTLILDNESSKKCVSRDFIRTLGLKEVPIERPYSISWIHQCSKLEIDCFVFQRETYSARKSGVRWFQCLHLFLYWGDHGRMIKLASMT